MVNLFPTSIFFFKNDFELHIEKKEEEEEGQDIFYLVMKKAPPFDPFN